MTFSLRADSKNDSDDQSNLVFLRSSDIRRNAFNRTPPHFVIPARIHHSCSFSRDSLRSIACNVCSCGGAKPGS
ncbi:hypothetical protein RB195_008500 [Necator americanus]|uniref:Uncharacterized protein n=1 Tax=Necator americanus TaxID=51031 RepID=A0ABR1CQT8_NECAM